MADERSKQLTKVSMNLSEKSLTNIDELSKLIHEPNRTRVVSSSLEIAKLIIKVIKDGGRIMIKDKDGETQELKLVI